MQHKKALSLILAILLLSSMTASQAFAQEAEKEIPQPTMQTIYVDGQSVQMEVYSVNGSDYVKLSDLANALNLKVYWDNGIHVQSSTAGTAPAAGIPANTAPAAAGGMTEAEAKAIALADAGVQENDAVFLKVKTDREHGIMVYEIDFYSNGMEYDYDIDISTGEMAFKARVAGAFFALNQSIITKNGWSSADGGQPFAFSGVFFQQGYNSLTFTQILSPNAAPWQYDNVKVISIDLRQQGIGFNNNVVSAGNFFCVVD